MTLQQPVYSNAPSITHFPQTQSLPSTPSQTSQATKPPAPAPVEPVPSFESIFNYLKLRHHNPYQLLNASAVNSFTGQFSVSEYQLKDDITLFYDHLNAFERVQILGEFESRGRDRPEGKRPRNRSRSRSKSPTRNKPRNKSPPRALGIDV